MSAPKATPTVVHYELFRTLEQLCADKHDMLSANFFASVERLNDKATQLLADSEARAVEAAMDDQHNKSYSLGYKDGWRDGRLPLNNPLPLALIEQHKAVNDAIWVTCSEHEWSWTHEQQVRMARYIMWAAPIITAERERVRVLEEALKAISRRAPIMASTGEYRRGQLHALQACSEVASAALDTLANPAANDAKEGS